MRLLSLGLSCLLASASFSTWSAERVPARDFKLDTITNSTQAGASVMQSKSAFSQTFKLKSQDHFQAIKQRQDTKGNTHTRYQQSYMGVPVWGESLVLHKKPSGRLSATGYIVQGIEGSRVQSQIESQAAMTPQAAIDLALSKNQHTSNEWKIKNSQADLVVYLFNKIPKLAYKIDYLVYPKSVNSKPSRPHILMDAINGKVFKQWEGLAHIETGTGPGGNEKTGLYEYGTDFDFLDVTENAGTCTLENVNVKTINLNHATTGTDAHSYECPRNTVKSINGAYSPLNDAHFFGNIVFNMFQDWLGIAPLSFQLVMQVHYDVNFENAFWDGTTMTFGDGGDNLYPLVDINVSAHEVSHGFTEQNSDLVYENQSGGINEAFSDIAGEAAEYYLKGSVDWRVGSDIVKGEGATRYFIDPTQDGYSIGHADDYYEGMDVHHSSGVFNKAFYLIANSQDWTLRSAFTIFAHANMNYWTSNTNFLDGACDVINATNDLNLNYMQVHNAFMQVGINCSDLPFIDSDNDRMDDNWETLNGLDPTNPEDAQQDFDVDGLTNLDEYLLGTLANNPDSDNDSLGDFEEVNTYGTSPVLEDSDEDLMPDGFEVEHGLNPLNPNDGLVDSDNDGYNNTEEFKYGTNIFDNISYPTLVEITFESGDVPNDWFQPEYATTNWYVTGLTAAEGSNSLASQAIGNDQAAIIAFTNEFAEGRLSFSAKVSSEAGWDYLIITLNDTTVFALTGEIPWNEFSIPVPEGLNTIQFIYAKDEIYSEGEDKAWVDNIAFSPLDSDNDGMPNYWENINNLNPNNPSDADQDPDNDNLTNYQEFKLRTDILSTDSDNDGMPDYWEFIHGLNPALNSDAYQDLDADGLNNLQEFQSGTLPNNTDTDQDGMSDSWEVRNNLSATSNDANLDADNDGLSNLQEHELGTNPTNKDSDYDGINDGEEVNGRGTSPINADSDNDGVDDGEDHFPVDPEKQRQESKKGSAMGIGSNQPIFILCLSIVLLSFRVSRNS